jgi:hypothetical protein
MIKEEFNENPNYLAGLMGIKKDFTINKISVNSEGLILELFFDDILYFASARNESNKKYLDGITNRFRHLPIDV